MAEAGKVRLVRCPKCENLLPELPDFSLYQCGGCGAVLKAKAKGILEDGVTEVSNDLKALGLSGEGDVVDASEVEIENAVGTESDRVEKTHDERVASNSSTSRAENREVLADSDISGRGKERTRRWGNFEDEYRSHSRGLVRDRNLGKDCDLNVERPEYVKFHGEHAVEGTGTPAEALRSGPVMDHWGVKRNGSTTSCGTGIRVRQGRYDNFLYNDEGPSSYDINSYYRHGDRTRYTRNDLDGIAAIDNLENGRAELLRKLDELKDQLSRSGNVSDKPKERVDSNQRLVPPTQQDPYGRRHTGYVQEGLMKSDGVNKKPPVPGDYGTPYLSQTPGYIPYTDQYGTIAQDSYLQRGYPREFQGYADAYQPDIRRGTPRETQSHYIHRPYHEQFHGYYGDVNHDLFMLQPHENFFHQPACSCVHCCNKNWRLPPTAVQSALHSRKSQIGPSNPSSHCNLNPILHGPQGQNSRGAILYPLHSRHSLTLNSNVLDSENDGFNYHHPRKVVVAHKNGRVWRPIAGGAPFITCINCFELLKLPRKYISFEQTQQKMKCGACSSIILFELGNEGYSMSISARVEQVPTGPTEIDDGSSGTGDENLRYWHGGSKRADRNTYSNDYDEFQPKLSLTDNNSNTGESEKQLDPLSPTSSLSEDEQSPGNLSSRKLSSPSVKLPLKEVNSADNFVVSRYEKGNKSKRSEQEDVSVDRAACRQNSVKDAAVATEMDVPLNEFSNGCVSQDSLETSKQYPPRVNKGSESFFAGLIKKSFRDIKKSNHNEEIGRSQVYVNGHLIMDRVVKKAEKLAGPIQPGEYWYDFRAGFWGVMGHPCMGIIMPNIEEFNYPMPENCAAGNTEVYVNGRELHQKDLNLLASRGLPITRHRYYIVDISGKVVDERTGEELDGLGKLAPTVEKAKHGFGMKVPRFIAETKS